MAKIKIKIKNLMCPQTCKVISFKELISSRLRKGEGCTDLNYRPLHWKIFLVQVQRSTPLEGESASRLRKLFGDD